MSNRTLVIGLLGLYLCSNSNALCQSRAVSSVGVVIGKPRWWINPGEDRNAGNGQLFLAGVVENRGSKQTIIGATFIAYTADGRPFTACNGVGEPSESVAPKERVLIYCNRVIVPVTTKDLQVTMRVEDIATEKPASPPPA